MAESIASRVGARVGKIRKCDNCKSEAIWMTESKRECRYHCDRHASRYEKSKNHKLYRYFGIASDGVVCGTY